MRLPPNLAERLQDPSLHAQLMTAAEAAALIAVGTNVGMSGFTGAAYPPPAGRGVELALPLCENRANVRATTLPQTAGCVQNPA